MRIAFVTANYPSPARPFEGSFVRQFVLAMARQGNACSVIRPTTVFQRRFGPLPPTFLTEGCSGGHQIDVNRPRYVSFSSRRVGPFHSGRWSNSAFTRVALKAMSELEAKPDLVYGHFMYPAGFTAVLGGEALGVTSVVGVGEGEFWTLEAVGRASATEQMGRADAFLAVSNLLADELNSHLAIPHEKIAVFPNGVHLGRFVPRHDRAAACHTLGIPDWSFNVGFVGPFTAKKGYPQLREAVAGLHDVRLVLLSRDRLPASDRQVAFVGSVPHDKVPDYLGACDIFVLPTAIEGSCNSVIEAMACGLPIVTADGPHMDDIVDDSVAIRVDPTEVVQIRAAIRLLKDDPDRRREMSRACLKKARKFDINERARRVTEWMAGLVRSNRS